MPGSTSTAVSSFGGTSDEFGSCDKELAAEMIRRAYPGRAVCIEE